MSEYTELTAKIEALEKRVKYLEDTFATLADMNKSGEMGQYIVQRQRALAASKLVNAAAGTQKLNADAQQQVIDQLAAEKAEMDARIEEAIRAAAQNTPAEDDLAEQFTYRDVPGGVEIQGFNGFEFGERLVIPTKIKGRVVVGIGENAFKNMDFREVILPQYTKYIEKNAIDNCKSLEKIELPETLQILHPCCFIGTSIKEIVFPKNLKEIGFMSFYSCKQLKKVILNEKIESIGGNAFEPSSLSKIVIPQSVKIIEGDVFPRGIHMAVLGEQTKLDRFEYRNATIYCLAGSEAQKQARLSGCTVKPLSDFKNL